MSEGFVAAAEDIRRAIETFNTARGNHERRRKILPQTTYWVYDPDSERFGPGKFVGLKGVTFGNYEQRLHEVTGTQTRVAIERALDDLFEDRPTWKRRLRVWAADLVGGDPFTGTDHGKWKFTSLRPKAGGRAKALADDGEAEKFPEGDLAYSWHLRRDRSAALVAKKKRRALQQNGQLACEACGFNFAKAYGRVGSGYIECHHTIPVSELRPKSKTRLEDVALVCSNCHRMIHRKRPWLTMEGIRSLVQSM